MQMDKVHHLTIDEVSSKLSTHFENGLSTEEASKRLKEIGPNELKEKPRAGFFKLLFDQFNNFLVIILIVATIVSFLLGENIDAFAILSIIILNALLGIIQETKTEKALAALKKMASPNAVITRNGHRETIPARELVPGDIVLLEAGNFIPADLRLVESINLKIDEASLTGESVPVNKHAEMVLSQDATIGDRKNSAFMGTMATYGRGKGIVTSTGMHTQIGMIAEMLQSYDEEDTPLQRKLDQLGKWLGITTLIICGFIFLFGIIRDTDIFNIFNTGIFNYLKVHEKHIVELFMTAVSLAIAAVPEGLPAVVTICLAIGMQYMVKRHALIRKLPAVETLGCATVICSDKTGTLTQNAMTVVKIWSDFKIYDITGEGYQPFGEFNIADQKISPQSESTLWLLLNGGVLCNDARLERSGESEDHVSYRMVGDPTEGALVALAGKARLWKDDLDNTLPRMAEIPFDSERKCMTTIHQMKKKLECLPKDFKNENIVFVKGAPDILLSNCSYVMINNKTVHLDKKKRTEILNENTAMAQKALRVLGIAMKPLKDIPGNLTPDKIEKKLIFLGLTGMIDPARPEVKDAISIAQGAGIKTVMVTGDYKDTAQAIAKEINLLSQDGKVLAGKEIDELNDLEFEKISSEVYAYARVSPQHKVKIVDALKKQGHIVAMTGDGVNDAPALKRADIGIAMGITGTDVTKETADVVLTDDNYSSIVSAIEQGRIIYSNIRKFVLYLLSCNVGEILIIFLSMLLGWPIPLSPIMLLWLNLVTDGAPAVALGMEKGEPNIMKHPPRPPKEPVINKDMLIMILAASVSFIFAILIPYKLALSRFANNIAAAQTVAFTTLVCSELIRAYTSRSEYYSVFSIGLFSNRWMVLASLSSFILLLLAIYLPPFQVIFGTFPLNLSDWLKILPFIFITPLVSEIVKVILRKTHFGK